MRRADPRILIAVFVGLLLLLAVWMSAECQTFEGAVKFEKGYSYGNQQVIDYYNRNIKKIVSVNGNTSVTIPEVAQAVSGLYFMVDGVPIQYKETEKGIQIIDVPIKAKTVNFKTEKVSVVDLNSDVIFRPEGYAKLIADKVQTDVTVSGVVTKPTAEPIEEKP